MTQEHPITPSPELVKQWLGTYFSTTITGEVSDVELTLATQAARWGAAQELEACCEWFSAFYCMETWMQKDLEKFRTARRPKPPSLKEQATAGSRYISKMALIAQWIQLSLLTHIRRALESLPD
jgi:hypothetical protein